MAKTVFRPAVYFHGYDLTGYADSLTHESGADALDATTFSDATKINVAGLLTASMGCSGKWDATPDLGLSGALSTAGKLISWSAIAAAGEAAYMMSSVLGEYNCAGQVGQVYPFSLRAAAASPLYRGTLCEKRTGVTATGSGTARQLGEVVAGKKLYAGVHCHSVSGTLPTLDLVIKSDATSAFSGAETQRIAFTQLSAIGSELKEVSGAITDTYWKPYWTIGGSDTPTFSFSLILAIL